MPEPNRPTPGRRPNQGALVVILAALMLVNLTTLGLLWQGGVIGGGGEPQDAGPIAQADDAERLEDPVASTTMSRDAEDGTTRQTDVQQVQPHQPGIPEREARQPIAVTGLTAQVAERSPESGPGVKPTSADPPLEFFGMRVFE